MTWSAWRASSVAMGGRVTQANRTAPRRYSRARASSCRPSAHESEGKSTAESTVGTIQGIRRIARRKDLNGRLLLRIRASHRPRANFPTVATTVESVQRRWPFVSLFLHDQRPTTLDSFVTISVYEGDRSTVVQTADQVTEDIRQAIEVIGAHIVRINSLPRSAPPSPSSR